jgi:hypothetical protein
MGNIRDDVMMVDSHMQFRNRIPADRLVCSRIQNDGYATGKIILIDQNVYFLSTTYKSSAAGKALCKP